eukprot:6185061-Pleurochrysis_carterae.AAC.2
MFEGGMSADARRVAISRSFCPCAGRVVVHAPALARCALLHAERPPHRHLQAARTQGCRFSRSGRCAGTFGAKAAACNQYERR